MKTTKAPAAFLRVLHQQPVTCEGSDCSCSVEVRDISQPADRVKTFHLRCSACHWEQTISGSLQLDPPWDEGLTHGNNGRAFVASGASLSL